VFTGIRGFEGWHQKLGKSKLNQLTAWLELLDLHSAGVIGSYLNPGVTESGSHRRHHKSFTNLLPKKKLDLTLVPKLTSQFTTLETMLIRLR